MKIIYTAPYKDSTGFGYFAQNQIRALDAAGVTVVPRAVKLNDVAGEVHPRILELEQNSGVGADAVIQNVLPHMMTYNKKAGLNIGYTMHEASNFRRSHWPNFLSMMDYILVPDTFSYMAVKNSRVSVPIEHAPMAVDTSKFEQSYKPISFREKFPDSFIFYYVGEVNRRKNVEGLLRAFMAEFDVEEPVELIIKTTPVNTSADQINKMIDAVKAGLKLYPKPENYKTPLVIVDNWKQDDLYRLHTTCDAFVTASTGESVCIPALDAMGFGRPVVAPMHTGFVDYISPSNSFSYRAQEDNCFGHDGLAGIYTADSECYYPVISELRRAMRDSYENESRRKSVVSKGMKTAYDFSLLEMGTNFKTILEELLEGKVSK